MARVSPVNSDGESANGGGSGNRKSISKASANAKKDSAEPESVNDDERHDEEGEGSDDVSEEESEYEIEAILDAKRGTFPGGRMGFFVKWKGYGSEQNSWVDEKDAGNADDLINDYWRKHKKEKRTNQRKSLDAKQPKTWRKSITGHDKSPELGSSAATKRSRKSQVRADSDQENGDDGEKRAAKKPRKSSGATSQPASSSRDIGPQVEDEIMRDDFVIGNMTKYMNVPDWNHLIDSVDTVEREDDTNLMVYFKLKSNGERVKENSRICAQRFPQKLIEFYESNLRWRTTDGQDVGGQEAGGQATGGTEAP